MANKKAAKQKTKRRFVAKIFAVQKACKKIEKQANEHKTLKLQIVAIKGISMQVKEERRLAENLKSKKY